MKKAITLILALLLLCGLTACGTNGDSARESGDKTADGSGSSEASVTVEHEYLYGKITDIVGNEIELSLVKVPEIDSADDSNSDAADTPDGAMAATPLQPAVPAGSIDDVGGGENIEYTGETISVVIPAGTKFYSMGQETTQSALKKGSLVSIEVDNLDDMNVQLVEIME